MKDIKIALAVTLMLFCAVGCAACGVVQRGGEDTSAAEDTTPPPETSPDTTTEVVQVSLGDMYSRGLAYESNGDGSCTLTGLGSCTDSCVIIPEINERGERVSAVAAGALAGSGIGAVQLPASVGSIGDGAFASCTSLAYIAVDVENESFCEVGGLLYTADMSRLLCIPAGSNVTTLNVTMQLRQVAPRASEGCSRLGKILFEGTETQWKCIVIGDGNAPLAAITPVCMKQAGK